MKLIKINEDYYVVVDDSEINESDWVFNEKSEEIYKITIIDEVVYYEKKITHSTQPLEGEFSSIIYKGYNQISLQEVKEIIGEVDVEKMAEVKFKKFQKENLIIPNSHFNPFKLGVIKGYNLCIEDNKEKKYTEEDMLRLLYWADSDARNIQGQKFEDFIQSLQPKTEWEVEIVDGKLKLK